VRAEFDLGLDLAEHLLALGAASGDPGRLLIGHMSAGALCIHRSEFAQARAHLDVALALCRDGHDTSYQDLVPETPLVWSLVFSAWNRWTLGDDAEAEREVSEAAGATGNNGYAATFAAWFGTWMATLRQDATTTIERCDAGINAAVADGFGMLIPFMAINRGWAIAASGDLEAGVADIEVASAGIAAAGMRMLSHMFAGFLADAYLRAGHFDTAEEHARRGLVVADETGERWYEPELHRLLGLALHAQGDITGSIAAVQQAVDIATATGGKALLARATTSLASLTDLDL
jgi:tetratricopeptide (TPR) repeat protein